MRKTLALILASLITTSYSCAGDHSQIPLAQTRLPHRNNSCTSRVLSPQPKTTAITNVNVFDGYAFQPSQTILIQGSHIVPFAFPFAIDSIIDGTDKYLIPGLMDSHVHPETCEDLDALASYGVTTAMLMACYDQEKCGGMKDQGGLTTDLLSSGIPAISPKTAHARLASFLTSGSKELLLQPDSDIPTLVQTAFRNGADFYKIVAEENGPSVERQKEIIREVHKLGKQTMTHASHPEHYIQAIESGTDGIQHVFADNFIEESTVEKIKANKNMFVTPTMEMYRITYSHWRLIFLLRGFSGLFESRSQYNNVQENVRRLHAAGIPLLAGTDAIGNALRTLTGASMPFGASLHCELENLVGVGLSPAEALRSATVVPAVSHRLEDRGMIVPGMRADLVLLNGNPLLDIRNARNIERVWIQGVEFEGVADGKTFSCQDLV
ncbi:hypothetical protein FB446DRAFT_793706 [Lentinula raphanica]|nr:hypothetical protein FB446DRAFT_793706 [Lentinula raphanica]